jgi:hypothetical protein
MKSVCKCTVPITAPVCFIWDQHATVMTLNCWLKIYISLYKFILHWLWAAECWLNEEYTGITKTNFFLNLEWNYDTCPITQCMDLMFSDRNTIVIFLYCFQNYEGVDKHVKGQSIVLKFPIALRICGIESYWCLCTVIKESTDVTIQSGWMVCTISGLSDSEDRQHIPLKW